MEKEREPPALVLFGRDQLVGESCALGLANLRLGQQTRVLDRPRGEVGQKHGPRLLLAIERPRADELERTDLLAPDPQREDSAVRRGPRPRLEDRRLRVEEVLRLAAGALQDLVGIERGGDRAHRLDQRLEEARVGAELLLDDLVPAPLRDDQVEGEPGRPDDRGPETGERDPARVQRQLEHRDDRGRRDNSYE